MFGGFVFCLVATFQVRRPAEMLPTMSGTFINFKGLINAKVDPEAQGRDTTFTLCHAQLRKPILLLEMAKGMNIKWPECTYHTVTQNECYTLGHFKE